MDAYKPAANGSAEFSEDAVGLGSEGRQDEQTAVDLLRLRLDTISVKLSRLELAFQNQRAFWRREAAYAAIIGALVMLSGVLGFALVWRVV
jgi:hypothetical protein